MALMMSHFAPLPIDTAALRVQGLGVRETMRPCQFDRPRGWGHYLFVLFHDAVPCRTNSAWHRATPGTLICWRPRTPHALGDPTRAWGHSWLSVGGSDVARVLSETRFVLDAPVPLGDVSFFDTALAELFDEVTRPAKGAAAMDVRLARSYVSNLIRRLARELRPAPARPVVPAALGELRAYIDAHAHEPLTLPDLAARAGWSVSQLCFQHQRHFGTPVMHHLRRVRLLRAAALLRSTDQKLEAVARAVGFSDAFHFSKAFRRQFGRPPGAFRTEG